MNNIRKHEDEEAYTSHIELRSEEVQEIMGQVPAWIIRWGLTVILFAILAAFTLAWFVKYPDVLVAQLVLTSDPPPLRLAAPTSGKIAHIFVAEKELVQQGDCLLAFESTADWRDVLQLEKSLAGTGTLTSLLPLPTYQLGSLQHSYSEFRKTLEAWQFFTKSDPYHRGVKSITSRQTAEIKALNSNIEAQLELKKRELELAEKAYEINRKLFEQRNISRVELEQYEVVKIQKGVVIKQLEAQIHNNEIQRLSYHQQMGEFGQQVQEDGLRLQVEAQEALSQLKSAIEDWKQTYMLLAPQSGQVAFFDLWAVSQQVEAGKAVISLLPHTQHIIGKATLTQQNIGKLRIGQPANIKLDNYNYKEFGMLPAIVSHISPLPHQDQYLVNLELTQGLKTTYNTQLEFRAEFYGEAEIITEELRLLERVFFEIAIFFTR